MTDDLTLTREAGGGVTVHVPQEVLARAPYQVLESPREDGKLAVRVSIRFDLQDAGMVMAHGRVMDYGAGRSQWGPAPGAPHVQVPTSGLINRFARAITDVIESHPAHDIIVGEDCAVLVSFLDHAGATWGQTEDPVRLRVEHVFTDHRWALIDRAMRLQRHTTRRLHGLPCEYEDLARVVVAFELVPS